MKIHLFITAFILIIYQTLNAQTYYPAFSFPQTNIFTKSYSKNALYAVGISNYKIYRANFTRNLSTITPTTYSTTHTKTVRTIAVSIRETFVATGSEDLTIEVANYFNQTKLCKFTVFNQLRALVFHPLYEQILYSGSVDDVIRKWNITNCSKIVQKTITGSIHSMDINPDGSTIAFGTLQGHAGLIDTNLNTLTQTLNAHYYTVLYTYYTYPGYYITIGDDAAAILWNQGTIITNYTALVYTQIFNCIFHDLSVNPNLYKIFTCYTDGANYVATYKVTNSTIQKFTTHGFNSYSSMNWVDYRQINTDQHIYIIHYQSSIVYDKLYDQNNTICSDHYGRDLVTKTCRMCGFMLQGCHFCDDSNTCTTCGQGTFQSGTLCTRCTEGCSLCSSSNNCNRCGVGYAPNGASGSCKTMGKTGCFYYTNNGNTCSAAANGYYVNSGGVVKICSNVDAACLQCTQSSSPSCLTCKTGFYVNGGTCASCATPMPGCLACMNNFVCMNCAVAYKMNGANLQCSNCYGTCMTCSYWYNNCLTCYSSQYRNLSTTNCNCLPGYYDQIATTTPTNFTCGLCSAVLTFCYQCTNTSVCTECQTNYYLYTSSGKTQCQLCTPYCQTCSSTSSNCTSCNPSYNRILSSNTCICSIGYVSILNSIPCQPCNRLNDGCILCINATYCSTCDIGYYIVRSNSSYQLCSPCPYYCPSCSVNGVGNMVCNSCPPSTFRTLTSGSCPCDSGYFDDNHTLICQKCSDILTNCLTCTNRTKCLSCAPGMYTDQAHSLCTTCMVTCATCGTYFDTCTTCDPASNRVLSNQKCICIAGTYQANGVCILCSQVIPNCNSCTNPFSCTGCIAGYTLQQDLKGCINCQGEINGCQTCTSSTNCTTCKSPFILLRNKCRCPLDQYTSDQIWGTCSPYNISGLKSSLNVQLQVHQHQNNTLIVFIRFRAKTLYTINKTIQNSIKMAINGIYVPINFDYIFNNHIKISTQINETMQNPIINITFDTTTFYNQNLLPLANINQTVTIKRIYYYSQSNIKTYTSFYNVLKYIFYILKWVFFGITLIGQGHLLFPFVIFIQLVPLFLTLNLALPATLSMILDSMFTFQIKSIVPLMSISSNFVVTFPNMVYDYYGLNDFFLFGKIGDMLLIILVNVFTKFDQGFVRMFPPGRIRRYVYQSLVRKGYAVMSLCILSLQPSFMLLAGVYINFSQWESNQEIFNYCSCVFTFGFYLAYNFNHASNLQGSKAMKNIQNQQCFLDLNSQQPTAARTTLFVLACDIWLIGSLHLISPMVYFITCIIFLSIRIILHIKRDYYIGKIQFALRIISNIFILGIYCIMMIFYLAEQQIYLSIDKCQMIGIAATALILCYLFFQIIQKILYNLKLQTDFLKVKTVQGQNGEQVVVQNGNQGSKGQNGQKKQIQDDKISTKSQKMKQFINTSKDNGGFSALNFRNKQNNKKQQQFNQKQQSNYPMGASNLLNPSYNNNNTNNNPNYSRNTYYRSDVKKSSNVSINNASMINGTDDFFKNSPKEMPKTQKQIRIKGANTSKYARNHLQLRYKAQGILTTHKNIPDEDK